MILSLAGQYLVFFIPPVGAGAGGLEQL